MDVDIINSLGMSFFSLFQGGWDALFRLMPFMLFLELPITLLVFSGVIKYCLKKAFLGENRPYYFPTVSCMVTCYSEGLGITKTIKSLTKQLYPGKIQIIAVIDGATRNDVTYKAALAMKPYVTKNHLRSYLVIPKWERGGRVSSLNTGLNFATGEIVMALDGDTSFDNNMVERSTRHFIDPDVAAVSGCLRVRNAEVSIATRLQAVEYFISILAGKTGLSEWKVVNNVSGAFGVFRKSVLDAIKGWDAGSAEDLDITLRIKNHFHRHKGLKILFDPEAIGFTDVPETFRGFFKQRLRWDGDLGYIYRKHAMSFSHKLTGWGNLIMLIVTGLFSQLVMPMMVFSYTVWLFLAFPLSAVLSIYCFVYVFYFAMTAFLWLVYVLLLSERLKMDLKNFPVLVIFPLFGFVYRLHGCFSFLWELIGHGSRDSGMAPWWVLRKNKF